MNRLHDASSRLVLPILILSVCAAHVCAQTNPGQSKPNVVVIVADDAGYADFGFMNGLSGTTSRVPTPNLDALAGRGVTFSRAYVGQSCQPTRAAIITGAYQNRIGNEVVGNNLTSANGPYEGVPTESVTIWERMQSQGYQTAAVGKWHLGQIEDTPQRLGNRPQNQGVEDFFGIWHGSRTYNVGNPNLVETQLLREATISDTGVKTDNVVETNFSGNVTNVLGQYAADYITERHADEDPFFLYQSFTAPHTPLHNSPDFNDPRIANLTGIERQYASMVLTMDREIGRILDRINDPNNDGDTSDSIADDTLVVFVNDNGGPDSISSSPNGSSNGVLRRGKGSPFEGGIRVPFIIAGAGVDASAQGTVYDRPVHGVDILPTAFGAAGGTFGAGDDPIDGVNLLPHINGEVTEDPHEVIVHRHRSSFAVIKGDYKLVHANGAPSTNYQLYNVVDDISETNNLARSNPELVAELSRDLTRYEAEFDKQRYAILGQTAEATINLFDRFTFRPDPAPLTGEQAVIGGLVGDGDFEAAGSDSGARTYIDSPNWFNASGSEGINFTNTTQTNGSSQPGSRAGLPFDNRTQVNNTGHTVGGEGETLSFSYDFGAGGRADNWNGDETLRLFLFTTDESVDGNLTTGDITILAEDVYLIDRARDGQWTTRDIEALYTTTAADIGKEIFLGIEFDQGTGNTLFPRIDVIELTASGITGGGGGTSVTNWSSSGAWFEGGTTNVETLFSSDAFAGAVLEFPTTNEFSYVSNNDMVRMTGQAFMLNSIVLNGDFTGGSTQSATIQGNEVLFTDSLEGARPTLLVEATGSGAAGSFSYAVDLDLVMFDDLTITGDGDVAVTINGQVRQYFEPRGLNKEGSSTVTLTAINTYEGDTNITGGTLALAAQGSIAQSASIIVHDGAIFDVSSRVTGGIVLSNGQSLEGDGTIVGDVATSTGASIAPGEGQRSLTIQGDVQLVTGSAIEVELGPQAAALGMADQLIVEGELDLSGGDLNVALADGYSPTSGEVFDVLQFSALTGDFGDVLLPELNEGLAWDTSDLLTTGEISVILPGDYNSDGIVNTADYAVWRDSQGQSAGSLPNDADGGVIGEAQYLSWLANFGASSTPSSAVAIPEPTAGMIALIVSAMGCTARFRGFAR